MYPTSEKTELLNLGKHDFKKNKIEHPKPTLKGENLPAQIRMLPASKGSIRGDRGDAVEPLSCEIPEIFGMDSSHGNDGTRRALNLESLKSLMYHVVEDDHMISYGSRPKTQGF